MSTLKTTNIQNASSATTNIVLDTSGNVTVGGGITASNGTVVMSSPYTMRNKIINGAMVIDQRNAGASVTQSTSIQYVTDRFIVVGDAASKFTAQQVSTSPVGFSNSILITSSSAYTVGAAEQFNIRHYIEGSNITDLAWGSASAQSVTLSFWVRSSLTGTFGGSVANSAQNRFYVFSYTINSADTWEQKTITIAGDTTGTWLTTNGIGIRLFWSLGTGSTYSGTAGSWGSTLYRSVTGATSVVGTNGATFYITGVQLERGTVATPFEYRNYQQELAMCQRYYYKNLPAAGGSHLGVGFCSSTTVMQNLTNFPVPMRTNPTALEQSGTATDYRVLSSAGNTTCSAVPTFQEAGYYTARTALTVASGLTAGQGAIGAAATTAGYLAWSAEL